MSVPRTHVTKSKKVLLSAAVDAIVYLKIVMIHLNDVAFIYVISN